MVAVVVAIVEAVAALACEDAAPWLTAMVAAGAVGVVIGFGAETAEAATATGAALFAEPRFLVSVLAESMFSFPVCSANK